MEVVSISKKPQDEHIYDTSEAIYILLNNLIIKHGVSHLAVVGILEECKLQYLQAEEEESYE